MSAEYDEANEPVRGLPEALPAGEHILWQGAPDWRTLARTAMHTHALALYFGLLVFARLVGGLTSGEGAMAALSSASFLAVGGAIAIGLLTGYAWLVSRTTVYTLTSKRFVLRHGVALPKAFNFPYAQVASAGLKTDARGHGDIPLSLARDQRVAYPHLWPHTRPFRFNRPEPMLRAIPDAALVAGVLGRALRAAANADGRAFAAEAEPAERPAAAQPALA